MSARRLIAAIATFFLGSSAFGGGAKYLGTIYVSDAGTVNNASTGYGFNSFANAFPIGTKSQLLVQCDEAAVVGVNTPGVDAGTGLVNVAAEKFPTATSGATHVNLPDGGTYNSGVVAVVPASGAVAHCRVFETGTTP